MWRPALLSVPTSDSVWGGWGGGGGPAIPGEERMKAIWAGGLVIGSERGVPRELTEPPQGRKEY